MFINQMKVLDKIYCISSPKGLVIISVFDTDIWQIFHEKRGSPYSKRFGIQKQLLNSVVLLFLENTSLLEGLSLLGYQLITKIDL